MTQPFLLKMTLASVFMFLVAWTPDAAQACRDCPFPMKVGEGRWIMPNGRIEVQIDERPRNGRMTYVVVTLRDSANGEVLAQGWIEHRKGKKTFKVPLEDRKSGQVMAEIQWIDSTHDHAKIGLTCINCAIGQFLE